MGLTRFLIGGRRIPEMPHLGFPSAAAEAVVAREFSLEPTGCDRSHYMLEITFNVKHSRTGTPQIDGIGQEMQPP
jgi:hypothetical protein